MLDSYTYPKKKRQVRVGKTLQAPKALPGSACRVAKSQRTPGPQRTAPRRLRMAERSMADVPKRWGQAKAKSPGRKPESISPPPPKKKRLGAIDTLVPRLGKNKTGVKTTLFLYGGGECMTQPFETLVIKVRVAVHRFKQSASA